MITKKNNRPRVLWFVRYGPDDSHMWESKPFNRLRDAREFAGNLPLTPQGFPRPVKIERFEYVQDQVYGDIVRISEKSISEAGTDPGNARK
jgi:hypothetical protein